VLAITVDLLAGRYTATQFDDRRQAEWPPHPARLYSALVATWADDDEPDPAERAALVWLERLDPPTISCDVDPGRRDVVDHYVPGNDARAGGSVDTAYAKLGQAEDLVIGATDDSTRRRAVVARDKARALASTSSLKAGAKPTGSIDILPEERNRQARTFPTVLPASPGVRFTWSADPDPGTLATLDGLCARVGRLGHSSTLVACRAHEVETSSEVAFRPTTIANEVASETSRLRIPRAGLLDRLELAHATHQGVEPRVLPARSAAYVRSGDARRRFVPSFAGFWTVLALPTRPGLSVRRALDVAAAVRGALMVHGPQPPPEVMCGHLPGPPGTQTPPTADPHLAVVPLPAVGHQRSDGSLLGVALVLPVGCTEGDRRALDAALLRWKADAALGLHLGGVGGRPGLSVSLRIVGPRDRGTPWTLRPERWATASACWRSVTPVVLDRSIAHVHSGDSARRAVAAQKVAASLAASCLRTGTPAPVEVEVLRSSPLVGIPPSSRFPRYRANGRFLVHIHASLRFAEPVTGPLIIGAGRFRGYGLLAPVSGER